MNYRVLRIEEDVDFGCEERKDGDPVMQWFGWRTRMGM